MLALFSDCRTLARHAIWYGPLDDPLLLAVPEVGTEISIAETWMLRIVDVAAAFGERGFPTDANATLDLELTDDVVTANAGRWLVEITGGKASASRVDREASSDTLKMDIRALASLYTGHLSARRLAAMDAVRGSAAALEQADRIFAAEPPSMPDYF